MISETKINNKKCNRKLMKEVSHGISMRYIKNYGL